MATYAPTNATAYELFRSAEQLYAQAHYRDAARDLEALLGHEDVAGQNVAAQYDARLLLARAYYQSAQLARAESMARTLWDCHPDDGYVALLLGRTLQRTGRSGEAAEWLRRAEALGQQLGR